MGKGGMLTLDRLFKYSISFRKIGGPPHSLMKPLSVILFINNGQRVSGQVIMTILDFEERRVLS
jgi:hypothetical protein